MAKKKTINGREVLVDEKTGHVLTGSGSTVNPTAINEQGLRSAELFARNQGQTATAVTEVDEGDDDRGIELPESDLPRSGGEKSPLEQLSELGISTSLPAVDRGDIERQTRAQFSGQRGAIQSRFQERIGDVREEREETSRALAGQLGTRRRFSSSARAFIQFTEDQFNKRIAELQTQMEEALNSFDFELASVINKRVSQARQEQREQINHIFKVLEFAQDLEDRQRERQEPFITASREAAIADLFNQGVTDISEIQEALLDAGEPVDLDFVENVVEKISQPSGLADVVADNPALFRKLTPTQMGEIAPRLQELGFDFGAALSGAQEFEIRSGPRGSILEIAKDSDGRVVSVRTIVGGTGSGGETFEFSSEEKHILIGGGFSLPDIREMEQLIEGGATLEDLLLAVESEEGKRALRLVLGSTRTEEKERALFNAQQIAEGLLASVFDPDIFKSREDELEEAKEDVKELLENIRRRKTIKVGNKTITLTDEQVDEIEEAIQSTTDADRIKEIKDLQDKD